jgi:hypothetical protein
MKKKNFLKNFDSFSKQENFLMPSNEYRLPIPQNIFNWKIGFNFKRETSS